MVPQCVGYASYNGPFQWLIVPVSMFNLRESINHFLMTASEGSKLYNPRDWVLAPTQEEVIVDHETLEAIRRCGGRRYFPVLYGEPEFDPRLNVLPNHINRTR